MMFFLCDFYACLPKPKRRQAHSSVPPVESAGALPQRHQVTNLLNPLVSWCLSGKEGTEK